MIHKPGKDFREQHAPLSSSQANFYTYTDLASARLEICEAEAPELRDEVRGAVRAAEVEGPAGQRFKARGDVR